MNAAHGGQGEDDLKPPIADDDGCITHQALPILPVNFTTRHRQTIGSHKLNGTSSLEALDMPPRFNNKVIHQISTNNDIQFLDTLL